MIINIKNNNDLITLDLRIKQIRYLTDIENRGLIEFMDLSNSDVEGYKYLYENNTLLFLNTIKEDLKSFLNKDINVDNLKII